MSRLLAVVFTALVSAALPAPAQDAPAKSPEGRFSLVVGTDTRTERFYLLTLGTEGGKPTAKVVAVAPGQSAPVIGAPTFEGGVLRFPLTKGGNRYDLEVRPDPKDPSRYLGSLDVGVQTFRATLEPTTLDKLTVADTVVPTAPSEGRAAIARLRVGENLLRRLADGALDADEGQRLAKEADAVAKANAPEIDRLRRKLALAGEGAASAQAARDLLAGAADAPRADVTAWVRAVVAEAAPYGPKVVAQTRTRLTASLARRGNSVSVALAFAEEAAADPSLTKRAKLDALKVLRRAQTQAGLAADADATAKRIADLDAE